MKKILLLLLIASSVSTSVMAQFQKGNKVLGFGLNFSTGSNEQVSQQLTQTMRTNSFSLSTELGFASGEHKLNGFFLNGGFGRQTNESSGQPGTNFKSDNYNIGGGAFMRRYKPVGKSFFVFGDGRAGFAYSEQNVGPTNGNNQKSYSVTTAIYPGIAYKWNRSFLLEIRMGSLLTAGYNYSKASNTNNNGSSTTSSFGFSSDLGLGYLNNIGIGARWILGQKK